MSRYIDADATELAVIKATTYGDALRAVREQLSIDIVFCKECRHRIDDDDFQEGHICLKRRANGGKYCKDNDFCSYGVKKGADDES